MDNQNPSIPVDSGAVIHRWQIPEDHQYERGRTWYVVMSLIALALIAYALFTANFLFALLILLFCAIIFMSHTRAPLILEVAVTDKGVLLNNRFYRYQDLKSFWIIHEPPMVKNLYLDFQGTLRPPLAIHLDTQEPSQIRQTLAQFLLEDIDKKEEPLSDLIWRALKL